jgi:hypothetical protein
MAFSMASESLTLSHIFDTCATCLFFGWLGRPAADTLPRRRPKQDEPRRSSPSAN